MTVATGIEIMPGGGSPRGLFQTPSEAHRPAWGANAAGEPSARSTVSSDSSTARAAWQSVLTSLGVGAPFGVGASKLDAGGPAMDESPDSDLATPQESTTGSESAKPLISGSTTSNIVAQITPVSVQVQQRNEFAGQPLQGHAELQQRAVSRLGISAPEAAAALGSAPAAKNIRTASSKSSAASDSDAAESIRRRKSSPAFEGFTIPVPEMASLQSTLIPSQAVQENPVAATPQTENLLREKNSFTSIQPESVSQSELAFSPAQTDLTATQPPLAQGARNEDFRAREVQSGQEYSRPQLVSDYASGPLVSEKEVINGAENAKTEGLSHYASGPAASKDELPTPALNSQPLRLSYNASGPTPTHEDGSTGTANPPRQRIGENTIGSVASKEDVAHGVGTPPTPGVKSSSGLPALTNEGGTVGEQTSAPNIMIAEPRGNPSSLPIGARVESTQEPISRTPAPASWIPVNIPVETGTIPASPVQPDAVKAAQTNWNAMPASNRSLESKPGPIIKGRELKGTSRVPVQDPPAIHSTAASSTPAESAHEKNAPAAVPDEAAPAPLRGTPGATEASNQVIHNHTSSGTVTADAVVPAAISGNTAEALPIPPSGSSSTVASVGGSSVAGEAFTALDAEGASHVTWVHAGAQQAEAGFQDPSLGWVSVRADVSGGVIHAALVPASADAAQVMGGHLEGLNSYLSAHHSGVENITLAAPSGRPNESAEFGASGQGPQQGAGQEAGQGASQDSGQSGQRTSQGPSGDVVANGQSNSDLDLVRSSSDTTGTRDRDRERAMQSSANGGRISVMA